MVINIKANLGPNYYLRKKSQYEEYFMQNGKNHKVVWTAYFPVMLGREWEAGVGNQALYIDHAVKFV